MDFPWFSHDNFPWFSMISPRNSQRNMWTQEFDCTGFLSALDSWASTGLDSWVAFRGRPFVGSWTCGKLEGFQWCFHDGSLNILYIYIYNVYVYIPRSQVCFLLRCLPTNQVLCVKDCLLTKSSVIWKRVMFWKWPTVTILIWSIPGVHHVTSWVPILSSRVVNPFPESSNL